MISALRKAMFLAGFMWHVDMIISVRQGDMQGTVCYLWQGVFEGNYLEGIAFFFIKTFIFWAFPEGISFQFKFGYFDLVAQFA